MVYLCREGGPRTSEIVRKIWPELGLDSKMAEFYIEGEQWSEANGNFTPVCRDEQGPFFQFAFNGNRLNYRLDHAELKNLGQSYTPVSRHDKQHPLAAVA